VDGSDLLVGVIAGVISAVLWTLAVFLFWWGRRRRRYAGLRGTFELRERFMPTHAVHWIASVTPSGNRLEVRGSRPSDTGRETFRGEILMSDELSNSGRGHYVRDDEPDAFGFWQVQKVDDNTLLVLETFANEERRKVTYGEIWTRTPE
jgi:hypothetical protein